MSLDFIYTLFRNIQEIVFLYPFAMSWVWMAGGLLHYFTREKKRPGPEIEPVLSYSPMISVLVPCHNESGQIEETIAELDKTRYPRDLFEVIAINDGSTDDTAELLDNLAERFSFLKVVHLAENKGKALALKSGALLASGEFLICIDGDALLEPNAVAWLVERLQLRPKVGAVTGNPRIRNRTTLLGKLQVGEFTTIIGLIKRTQMNYGKIFTISGVVAGFRKKALQEVGYWSPEMITDDIDITWKLQKNGWFVLYEPNGISWILMPETLKGLWRQRLRWAQGAAECALKHGLSFFKKKSWRMLPILLEYFFTIVWAHAVFITMLGTFIQAASQQSIELGIQGLMPAYWGFLLGITFFLQSFVSFHLERRYEPCMFHYFAWMIWYPVAYWAIMAITACVGWYKALLFGRKTLATWVSPDRGIR
ncbi:MAG: poly-beta-1,6-N-acetyl-D-glucosamine synthase [Thermodesulfobacteriota bacterium]